MKLSALLAPLFDAKADHELIRQQIMAYEAEQIDALQRRRESDAKRQATKRGRDSHVMSRDVTVTVPSRAPDLENKQTNKQEKKDTPPSARMEFAAELSTILDPVRIEALVAVRRKKGATFSAHAGRLLVKALSACSDIPAAADEMVLRNWTGIKPEWMQGRNSTAPPNKPKSLGEMFRDDARKQGILNDTSDTHERRLGHGDGARQGGGSGIARRFAIEGDVIRKSG